MIDYRNRKRIDILGVFVDRVGKKQALATIVDFLDSQGKYFVTTVYSEMIVAAHFNSRFKNVLNSSSMSLPDGIGILAAADFLGFWAPINLYLRAVYLFFGGLLVGLKIIFSGFLFRELNETVSGSDLIYDLAEIAQERGYRFYLLGGKNEVAESASAKLVSKFPKLSIGYSGGLANIRSYTKGDNQEIINEINEFNPRILLVAYGPPYQETWICDNLEHLNVKVALGVGGSFDMVSGRKKRAPRAFRFLSLEWLWRLLIEPLRLKRIFSAVFIFPSLVYLYKLRRTNLGCIIKE